MKVLCLDKPGIGIAMNTLPNDILALGYDEWFQMKMTCDIPEQHDIARVISVHKDSCLISKGGPNVYAELSGKLLYSAETSLELPATGDWVEAAFYDENTHAIIYQVFPRKTELKRKTAGKNVEFQLIAANIDFALIIQSLNEDFNLNRLERYLVMVNEAGIKPIILLSKSDLLTESEKTERITQIQNIVPKLNIIAFSNNSGFHVDTIHEQMQSGKTYCLLGSSGVGKTSLLNSLCAKSNFQTAPIREADGKGRHTTTSRELIRLESGALVIDTPGMRELGNIAVQKGIDSTFSDIVELMDLCKYHNCTHTNEAGCAVLEAINKGSLSEHHYQNYLRMIKESDYNAMSYVEKRKKDKALGKFYKSVTNAKNKYK